MARLNKPFEIILHEMAFDVRSSGKGIAITIDEIKDTSHVADLVKDYVPIEELIKAYNYEELQRLIKESTWRIQEIYSEELEADKSINHLKQAS